MSSQSSDPNPSRSSGLLARLMAMVQAQPAAEETASVEEASPAWDAPTVTPGAENVPVAQAVPAEAIEAEVPLAEPINLEGMPEATPLAQPLLPATPSPESEPLLCPICGSPRQGSNSSCADCGYYFSEADLARARNGSAASSAVAPAPASLGETTVVLLRNRYEVHEKLSERPGVTRYRGLDRGVDGGAAVPVVIIQQEMPPSALPVAVSEAERASEVIEGEEILPSFDETLISGAPTAEILPSAQPIWPNLTWEQGLLETTEHSALPRVLAAFTENNCEYLVEEMPTGQPLWDAWDDPEATSEARFGWLAQIAEALHRLHANNAMLESLRPDIFVVAQDGGVRFTDLSELLPLPLPSDPPLRGSLYTAPELLAGHIQAGPRSTLYSFGAMLYALHVGRELSESDFTRPGHPKPFLPRFPDIHPAFGRLLAKTFCREVDQRFPTDEASKEDVSGFLELVRTLQVLRRTFDIVRLEIASWTTTGMIRTGNEDAFALLHACESRQDDVSEMALVLLCDGMGGYEAGEVAAALAIQVLRQNLLRQPPFAALAGASSFTGDVLSMGTRTEGHAAPPLDVEECERLIKESLKEANKQVFTTSRQPGSKRRGMGCTAEVVFVDGRHVIVGHVGDSRTYHLHEGRLIQLTRDQTLVNRLVELGTLTPEEAETHPRRNELQQAIGGQPDVEPGVYHGVLQPGDWVVVCSDGVTNHVSADDLKQMLQSEATSAEMAARRLVNLTNIQGATDNATVVVIRAT